MGLIAEGPQDEDVQTLKEKKGVLLNSTAVGYVSQGADPVTQNL